MNEPFLSVVMPVYNEKDSISKIIAKVLSLPILRELIIVDDCSNDGTREILKKMKTDDKVKIVYHDRNTGKGGALRTGFKEVKGDIVAVQDADMEYDPEELNALVGPITDGVADVVYGSRLSGGKPQRVYMFWHRVGNGFLTLLTNILYNTTLSDMETGYKVFRRSVISDINIRSNDFTVEPELTAKILKKNVRVYEIPISYYGRTFDEGKKIRWYHGLSAMWALLRYRFTD